MQEILRVTWRLAPRSAPRLWRSCRRCGRAMPFRCSMKFRTNAQKKRIDVWLIYRCEACEETWNLPVLERALVGDIPASQLEAFAGNDPALAARHAFDIVKLRQHSDRVQDAAEIAVEKSVRGGTATGPAALAITLVLASRCRVRLDGLLSRELGLARGRLAMLLKDGHLTVAPLRRGRLGGPALDGQRILVALDAPGLEPAIAATIRRRALL